MDRKFRDRQRALVQCLAIRKFRLPLSKQRWCANECVRQSSNFETSARRVAAIVAAVVTKLKNKKRSQKMKQGEEIRGPASIV